MPSIMMEDIMDQFQVGASGFGQFSGVYYIGYSLMHLPVGIMLDRYGPKKVMTISILFTVLGLLPLIFADQWIFPVLGRALMGMGSSAAILGLFKIIRMTFKEEQFPRMLSYSVTIGLIGAIYGGGPVSYMREAFGYKSVVGCFAIIGLVLALITYLVIPNVTGTHQGSIRSNIKEVLNNRRVIWLCLFAGLMVGPLEGFADVWGAAFFRKVYGFDAAISASLPSMIFIGMCFGAPILNMVAEKVGNYLITIIFAGFIMAASFAALLIMPLTPQIMSVGFILVGICSAYQILAIFKATTYVREEVAGLTTAVANMIIMIFGYGFHTVIGGIINYMGGPQYTQALSSGLIVIPVTLLIGTLGFILLYFLDRAKNPTKTNN